MANSLNDREAGNSDRNVNAPGLSEDLLRHDPLLDCLLELTRIHGRPSTRAALSAGLPLSGTDILTPSLFARAAAKAGFSSKLVRRELDKIDLVLLPVVLLLQDNEACLLLGWNEDGSARLLLPESGQGGVTLSREALLERYAGIAIYARPHFRFDERTPAVVDLPQKHWFWGVLLEQLPLYRDVLYAALLINLFALALPLFTMNVYDRVVPNYGLETLWMLAFAMLLVIVLDYTVRLMRCHFIDLASARIDVKLSSQIMEKVLGMRLADRPASVGSFASILRSFESIRDFIASATVVSLIDLPFALLFLLTIGWISPFLAIVPVIGAVVVIIYGYVIQHKMGELAETTFRAAALRNGTLVESLATLETLKANRGEGVVQEKWERSAAFLSGVNAQMRLLSSSVTNGMLSVQQLVTLISVIIGVYLIHENMLSMGGLIAVSMLQSRAMGPLAQLVALLMQFQNARSAMASLDTLMNRPGERDGSNYIHRPEIQGEIEFRDVNFSYGQDKEQVLSGISLRIKPGEKVVVIGRVGSGKTTLQKLVMGLYTPQSGSVLVDGIDLRQLDPADLRRNIGYVGQDGALFYGTLRDNISLGAPFADDRAIVDAAEIAGLTEFVNRHSKGFDMLIGERGESLSGGQRQSVLIARSVLLDPPIILLDEPTSAFDFSSEAAFKEKLRGFVAEKTMILVTHRTSLLDLATRVVVIEGGKVIADGPRAQVLEALQSGRLVRGG